MAYIAEVEILHDARVINVASTGDSRNEALRNLLDRLREYRGVLIVPDTLRTDTLPR